MARFLAVIGARAACWLPAGLPTLWFMGLKLGYKVYDALKCMLRATDPLGWVSVLKTAKISAAISEAIRPFSEAIRSLCFFSASVKVKAAKLLVVGINLAKSNAVIHSSNSRYSVYFATGSWLYKSRAKSRQCPCIRGNGCFYYFLSS
jgi:hypothetical protein